MGLDGSADALVVADAVTPYSAKLAARPASVTPAVVMSDRRRRGVRAGVELRISSFICSPPIVDVVSARSQRADSADWRDGSDFGPRSPNNSQLLLNEILGELEAAGVGLHHDQVADT